MAPTIADTVQTQRLSPAVRLHRLVTNASSTNAGPWKAAVLELDLTGCVNLRALKGNGTAVGRSTTSALLAQLPSDARAIAAVNADFFLFAPPGVLTGAHVESSRLITGPGTRAVLAFDSAGRPYIGPLSAVGTLRSSTGVIALGSWNRPELPVVGVLDGAWGATPDSSVTGRWRLVPVITTPGVVRATSGWRARYVLDSAALDRPPTGDTLLLVRTVAEQMQLRVGDTVDVTMRLAPLAPQDAVGGFPLLVRSGVLADGLATAGSASFRGLNPRTAVGIGDGGRRLFLVVVDGRQPAWSVGMSTEATARLLLALGADDALNLDGGGSTAMVVRDAATARTRLVSRPSDSGGERAVGNALLVMDACGEQSRSQSRPTLGRPSAQRVTRR